MWFCNMCTGEVAKMLQGQGTKPDGIERTNQAYDNKLAEVTRKLDKVSETMLKMIEILAKKEENLDIVIEEKVGNYMDERREKEEMSSILFFTTSQKQRVKMLKTRKCMTSMR